MLVSTGIDICEDFVNIVWLRKIKNTYSLIEYRSYSYDLFKRELEKRNRNSLKIKSAIIAVPYSQVMTKNIRVDPSLNDEEILNYLKANIQNYLKLDFHQISMDFHVLDSAEKNLQKKIRIVVANKTSVSKKIDLLNESKIKIKAVNVELFALERVVALNKEYVTEKLLCIIHIGNTYLLIIGFKDSKTVYAKEENINSFDVKKIANQIYDEFKIFSALFNNLSDQIILSGQIPNTKEIVRIVREKTKIKASILNPFSNVTLKKNIDKNHLFNIAHTMTISCGLAL